MMSNKEHELFLRRQRAYLLKKEVIGVYGGKCECCGETNLVFLTIEHKFHDGKAHRKACNRNVYADLKRRKFPKNIGIGVLCHNCQFASKIMVVCPHKVRKIEQEIENESATSTFAGPIG